MKRIFLTCLVAMLPVAVQAEIDKNAPAAKLCVDKVAEQMGVSTTDVAIYDMLQSEAATVVFVTVGSLSGAWKCFVTPDGQFDGIEEAE